MYKEILGPTHNNTDIEYVLISVLPKSGYLAVNNFLKKYADLLNGKEPDITTIFNWVDTNQFNKKLFTSWHMECFQFYENVSEDKLKAWSILQYSDMLPWNYPAELFPAPKEFSPQHRVVFIFRNPLDQMLSFYLYLYGSEMDIFGILKEREFDIKDFEDFIFNRHALSSYIKLFYTFHVVRKKYPEHILFVPYESIVQDKPSAMKRILAHVGAPYSEAAFNRAIDLSSLENMKECQDTMIKNERFLFKHIRDGGIGLWQSKMTPDIVQRIEKRFNEFDLSLNMFHLAAELEPQYKFLQSKPKSLALTMA